MAIPTAFEHKVVLDDLDYLNHVGHAQWLFILERSRTDFLEQLDLPLPVLLARKIACVVAEINIRYQRAGKYGDKIRILNTPKEHSNVGIKLESRILDARDKEMVSATFTLIFVDANGRPTPIPEDLKTKLFGT